MFTFVMVYLNQKILPKSEAWVTTRASLAIPEAERFHWIPEERLMAIALSLSSNAIEIDACSVAASLLNAFNTDDTGSELQGEEAVTSIWLRKPWIDQLLYQSSGVTQAKDGVITGLLRNDFNLSLRGAKRRNNVVNYLGQLRLYSLVDLLLFFWAVGATPQAFCGGVVLWIGFLCYLEEKHRHHQYRRPIVPYLWLAFLGVGVWWYGDWGVAFFVFGILYAEKERRSFAPIAPLFRGAQMVALTAPLLGIEHPYTWGAGVLICVRNLLGDVRDAGKDAAEGMRTLPVLLGLRRNVPYVYLLAVMTTSFMWWSYGDMPLFILFSTWLVQICTYHLTPR